MSSPGLSGSIELIGVIEPIAPPATQTTVLISAAVPDWSRERKRFLQWSPARSLLASIRAYRRYDSRLLRAFAVLRHTLWSALSASDIRIKARIGGGLLMPHPVGIVIHDEVVIGPNCLIQSGVVIGTSETGGVPHIGGHVDIGAGAKILGAVTIGDHARIGANAVVLRDVPAGATAVGVPARIIVR